MSALLELAERCEAATAEQQRALIIEAAEAALMADGHDADTEETMGWLDRFEGLVNAGAFLDAAMTLVPEGQDALVRAFPSGKGGAHVYPAMRATLPMLSAATPALALCAAALRARAAA